MNRSALLLALLVVGVAVVALYSMHPEMPQTISSVEAEDVDGKMVQIPADNGVTLIAFFSTTCSMCRAKLPIIVKLAETHADRGLKVVGVAVDYENLASVRAYRDHMGMHFPVLHDRGGAIARRYGNVRMTPSFFVVSPDLTVLDYASGSDDTAGITNAVVRNLSDQLAVIY
ncbi:TlpA disulfide reductase family protein [Gammaproteobacteria bacterium]|nr:TlpA disulfide reductase family protein [Gammaproteobacteria bacterium]